jgi:hypothetical protein
VLDLAASKIDEIVYAEWLRQNSKSRKKR